jgi:hypothetical protein
MIRPGSPLQNRVLPTGEIAAMDFRGLLMGNRGILHGRDQRLKTARWTHPHWVTCLLSYKGWHRPVMTPRNYTELFFLDECVALAAGHRPCGLCRRDDFNHFKQCFTTANNTANLNEIDRLMHKARVCRNRSQRRFQSAVSALPDGTFIWHGSSACLIWRDHLLSGEAGCYTKIAPRPARGSVTVLTPAPTVAALARGYRPGLHPSALALLGQ